MGGNLYFISPAKACDSFSHNPKQSATPHISTVSTKRSRLLQSAVIILLILVAAIALRAAPPIATLPPCLHIVISKANRSLEVFRGTEKIHHFRVGLGNTPVGDKVRSGDGKTPEGTFNICVKNPKSQFYLSLGISYPDSSDAERGLRDGIITRTQHDQIVAATAKKTTPPWNTPLGGEIFIHGNGSSSDWTLGCIALEDAEMKTLFNLIDVGTLVEIMP